jgi:sulfane dehydrogenase subunit SoxC
MSAIKHPRRHARRRFLKDALLAGLATGTARPSYGQTPAPETVGSRPEDNRGYGRRSRYEVISRWPIQPKELKPGDPLYLVYAPSRTPLQDLRGIITPNPLHYFVDASAPYPIADLNPKEHRLVIDGMVDRPMEYTLADLKLLPSVSRICWLECTGNGGLRERNHIEFHETLQMTHGATSCAEWTGVPLSLLLQEAGVQKGARWIYAEGNEHARRAKSFQLEKALEDVLVAYAQNGEAIRPENGYPVRLIVPGWSGHNSVKWLRTVKVTDRPYMAKDDLGFTQAPDGTWIGEREFDPKSVIAFPSGGQKLPGPGVYELHGLAWTGGGVIRRVEVTTDGGRTWKEAQLQEPILPRAHTRFRLLWTWNGEETVIESRCTDEGGRTQKRLVDIRKQLGDDPDNWRSSDSPGERFSGTQPWKILRDGSVHQAAYGPHMYPPPGAAAGLTKPFRRLPTGGDSTCLA